MGLHRLRAGIGSRLRALSAKWRRGLTSRRRSLLAIPVYLLLVGIPLWWVFRGEDLGLIWRHVRNVEPLPLLAAVVVTTAGFWVRAVRWKLYLDPAAPGISFNDRFQAVCIGGMANNLLPARLGELARAAALARLGGVSGGTGVGTLVVERAMDAVAIILLMGIAVAGPAFPSGELPPEIQRGVSALLIVLLAATAAIIAWAAMPRACVRALRWALGPFLGPPEALERASVARRTASRAAWFVLELAERFGEGMRSIGDWRLSAKAFAWSLLLWTLQGVSFQLGFIAFGIDLGLSAALFTNAVVSFAVALPSTPGFFGLFQAAAKLSLVDVFGADSEAAVGFAFGWHLGAFVPVTLMGFVFLRRLGLGFRALGSARPGPEPKLSAIDKRRAPPKSVD